MEASRHTLELGVLDAELGADAESAESPQHSVSSSSLMASLGHRRPDITRPDTEPVSPDSPPVASGSSGSRISHVTNESDGRQRMSKFLKVVTITALLYDFISFISFAFVRAKVPRPSCMESILY